MTESGPVPLPPRVFRIVSPSDVARGRFDVGRLAVGASEEEIRAREDAEGCTLVELMTEHQRSRLHLDARCQRRWRAEEDAQEKRMADRRDEFVRALTAEVPSTSNGEP